MNHDVIIWSHSLVCSFVFFLSNHTTHSTLNTSILSNPPSLSIQYERVKLRQNKTRFLRVICDLRSDLFCVLFCVLCTLCTSTLLQHDGNGNGTNKSKTRLTSFHFIILDLGIFFFWVDFIIRNIGIGHCVLTRLWLWLWQKAIKESIPFLFHCGRIRISLMEK